MHADACADIHLFAGDESDDLAIDMISGKLFATSCALWFVLVIVVGVHIVLVLIERNRFAIYTSGSAWMLNMRFDLAQIIYIETIPECVAKANSWMHHASIRLRCDTH